MHICMHMYVYVCIHTNILVFIHPHHDWHGNLYGAICMQYVFLHIHINTSIQRYFSDIIHR